MECERDDWSCSFIYSFIHLLHIYCWVIVPHKGIHDGLDNSSSLSSSVQFSRSVVSNSWRPHVDCSTPGFPVHHQLPELAQTHVHQVGNAIQPSHPLSCPYLPAFNLSQHQGLFQCQFFASGGQSIGVSASASVLPMAILDWFPLGWTGWISLQSKRLSRVPQHHSSKTSILHHSAFFTVQISHPYMTTGKTIALPRQTFVDKVMSLLFNMLSRLVIAFLPRSKHLLISWLQSPSAVILEPEKIKSLTVSTVSPSICLEVMGPDVMILVFSMLSFKPTFSLSLSLSSRGSLVPLLFLP